MTASPAPDRAAIIDVGSNSVRLVIYEVHGAAALPTFNEKTMAGLGRGLSDTGAMSDAAMDDALAVLRRFKAILQALDVTNIEAVATAAVRQASNGPAFARRAAMVLGQDLRVLSGADEGQLSALGVASGVFDPKGLVGDLGGSSLEFYPVRAGDDATGETHFVGPLALGADRDFDEADVRSRVRKQLKSSDLLKADHKRFYAVGGAWRALAKLQMDIDRYPLRVLQGYTMRAKDVRRAVKAALSSASDPTMRARVDNLMKRRAGTLPYAAVVLDELLDRGDFSEVVVSSYGLREGVLRDLVGNQDGDPLLDGAAAFTRLSSDQTAFGVSLYDFVAPALAPKPDLFGSFDADDRIDRAACLLADSGGRFHPDHRASMAFDQALRAPYAGLNHQERVFIAAAVGWRYSRGFSLRDKYVGLMSDEQIDRARRLGTCMRLGAVFSGRSAPILNEARLERGAGVLTLVVLARSQAMVSQTVERRLAQTATALGVDSEIVTAKT